MLMAVIAKLSIVDVCGNPGYTSILSVCYNILHSIGNIDWHMIPKGL